MGLDTPDVLPTAEELGAMEFDDLPGMLEVLYINCDVDAGSINMTRVMTDKVISFFVGGVRINTPPDSSGKVRFTADAIKILTRPKA